MKINPSVSILATAMMALLLIITTTTSHFTAASNLTPNSSNTTSNSRIPPSGLLSNMAGEADMEMDEFMMDSEISSRMRMLAGSVRISDAAKDRSKTPPKCGQTQRYCVPNPNRPSKKQNCGTGSTYNRNCR